ncbi:predicted protein [Naegleria gruberi]|uniref:Predicted protein n=1 Tax=Naegleria gruberi TaxID=5762 RepID=D2W2G7_NAEGR|nr:uncharacterized protein NAEGRDRAFT_75582 [Naegleria gruberi]EFC36708.1 predicted protein [Naegleria gruberi]|eukprot:XP_002669452.1 predicted protein [Naegleria gruberi strain NEG-M]
MPKGSIKLKISGGRRSGYNSSSSHRSEDSQTIFTNFSTSKRQFECCENECPVQGEVEPKVQYGSMLERQAQLFTQSMHTGLYGYCTKKGMDQNAIVPAIKMGSQYLEGISKKITKLFQ